MKRIETIQAALNVLRCCVNTTAPASSDLEILQRATGIDVEHMAWDELARAVVQQYLDDSKAQKSKGAGTADS